VDQLLSWYFYTMLLKVQILTLLVLLPFIELPSQTCCSGGVPLTGNLGMPSSLRGTWQLSPSYDLNYMNTLKSGDQSLNDANRKRVTQSLIFETGYSLTDFFQISALFTYVFQSRETDVSGAKNKDFIHGIGDAVLLFTYRAGGGINQKWELLLGMGPKLPLGSTDMTRPDGISYSADLQPGSGAWDAIFWGLLSRTGILRPTSNISLRMIYRYTGINDDYLGFSSYRFGNEFQIITGISDQVNIGTEIFNPSLLLRYRNTRADFQGELELSNTGGNWLYLGPGLVYQTSPDFHARLAAEIPLYSNLQGTQLTTDFRITAGFYFRINSRKVSSINI
jgi:hypothetical protein